LRQIEVLFENDFCLVLNKPPGLPVQGGKAVRVSLDSILSETVHPRPFLVHRLDKETSGLILVAKTRESAQNFSALFSGGGERIKERVIVKKYLGVCSGIPSPEQGLISDTLDLKGKQMVSITRYKLLSSRILGEAKVSLLELELGTGRMHQIRRHLAMKGCPILGDDKYGNFRLNKTLRKTIALKNLLLHASKLSIPPSPPFLPDGLEITAPLPEYFSGFLDSANPGFCESLILLNKDQ